MTNRSAADTARRHALANDAAGLPEPPTEPSTVRLLPWSEGGKPAYLHGTPNGFLAQLADNLEAVQLGMGAELLGHADQLLADPKVTAAEFRYLSVNLVAALRDALRVAKSRGLRLDPTRDEDEDQGQGDDEDAEASA